MSVTADSPTPRPVVGVSVLVWHEGRVLLVRRARAPYAGCWSPPGGRVEFGESLRAAAAREALEETGISVEVGGLVETFDIITRADPGSTASHFVLIVLAGSYLAGTPMPGDDAAEAAWLSPAGFAALPLTPQTAALLLGRDPGSRWPESETNPSG